MSYRDLATVPIEPGATLEEHTDTIRRLTKMVNSLSKQVDVLKSQRDAAQIQGLTVTTTAPTPGQRLTYDGDELVWETP